MWRQPKKKYSKIYIIAFNAGYGMQVVIGIDKVQYESTMFHYTEYFVIFVIHC